MSENSEPTERRLKDFLQEWWSLVTVISTSLGALLTGLTSEGLAKIIGFVLSIVLVGIAALLWIRREKRSKEKKLLKQKGEERTLLNETSSFRGLYSFKLGDVLPGADRQLQARLIYTQITDPHFSFGVICGETGCGKSSILHAGIVKLLEENKRTVIIGNDYKSHSSKQPLQQYLNNIESTLDKHPTRRDIFLIIDQFEDIFIGWQHQKDRNTIAEFLFQETTLGTKILLALRKDFLADIKDFEPAFPNPLSSKNLFYIKNFTTNQAKEVIEVCAKNDGLAPSAELVETLAKDLTQEGYVRPVQLQLVCTALLTSFDINSYRINGGVKGILSSYLKESIDLCNNPVLAQKVLRSLCDFSAMIKTQPKTVSALSKEIASGANEAQVAKTLTQLELSKVVILIHEEQEMKAAIIHDYLIESINTTTSAIATKQERANQLIKYYVYNYRQHAVSIPWRDVRFIKKNADKALIIESGLTDILRKQRVRKLSNIALFAVLVVATSLVIISVITHNVQWKGKIIDTYTHPQIGIFLTDFIEMKGSYATTKISSDSTWIWDVNTWSRRRGIPNPNQWLTNKSVLSWNEVKGTISLHDIETGNVNVLSVEKRFKFLVADSGANYLAIKPSYTDTIEIWSMIEKRKVCSFFCRSPGNSVAKFDQKLSRLFMFCRVDTGNIQFTALGVWEIKSGQQIGQLYTDTNANVRQFVIDEKNDILLTVEDARKPKFLKLSSWKLSRLSHIKSVDIHSNQIVTLSDNHIFLINSSPVLPTWKPVFSNSDSIVLNTQTLIPESKIAGADTALFIKQNVIYNKKDSTKTYIFSSKNSQTYQIELNLSNTMYPPIIKGDSILIVLKKDSSLQILDIRNNLNKYFGKLRGIRSVSLSLDKDMLIISRGEMASVLDLNSFKIIAEFEADTDWLSLFYDKKCRHLIVWATDKFGNGGKVMKYVKTRTILGKDFRLASCE